MPPRSGHHPCGVSRCLAASWILSPRSPTTLLESARSGKRSLRFAFNKVKVVLRAVRLHETSRFVRQGGQWWYVDGDMDPIS